MDWKTSEIKALHDMWLRNMSATAMGRVLGRSRGSVQGQIDRQRWRVTSENFTRRQIKSAIVGWEKRRQGSSRLPV